MIRRTLFSAAIALLLGGCAGWWSETRLIPVAARDTAGLAGMYTSGEDRAFFAPTAKVLVRATAPSGKAPDSDVALALLREEAPEPSLFEGAETEENEAPRAIVPDRSYLMEIPVENAERGTTAYFYAIARIGFAPDGSADEIKMFSLLCSKATEAFAARKEQQVCIFDDYARLRAAAFDVLAWYDDPRMELDTTEWRRESNADDAAPEPF